MTADSEFTPSLSDLTFDVEPKREWTPPNPHSPEAGKLWEASESLRTVTSTASATVSRPSITSKPSVRPSTDTRVYDIRRAHPPSMVTHKQSSPLTSASPSPNKQPAPSPSAVVEPYSASEPNLSATVPGSTYASGPEPDRSIHTPRRGNASPVRVVCPEPSLAQLSILELPSVRGQNVTSTAPSGGPTSTSAGPGGPGVGSGGTTDGAGTGSGGVGGVGAGFAARRLPAAHGPAMLSDAAGGSGGGYPLADHMSGLSSQMTSANQDPVDAYLARYQMHQRINDQFRVRHDQHFRTVQELGARIQAMTKGGSAGAGSWPSQGDGPMESGETGAAEGTTPLSPSGESSPPRHGTASLASTPYHHHQHPHHHEQQQQQLPDHPLRPRNRFVPPSVATHPSNSSPASASTTANAASATTSTASPRGPSGHRRPNSASSLSSCPSPARCASAQLLKSGLTGDGAEPSFGPSHGGGGVGGGNDVTISAATATRASPIAPRGPHPQQGAYLALPDGSFAGSAPLRGMPITEGLLFEKYSRKSQAVDLPELQLRYIRPGIVAPREPRPLRQVPRQPPPPTRALPNGIPASRLERLSARRRDRSPPRLHQQHLLLQHLTNPAELLKFTGAPVANTGLGSPGRTSPTGTFSGSNIPAAAAAGGSSGSGSGAATELAAVGDGLLRSSSLMSPGPAVTGGGGSPGRARSPGVRAASAPSGPEGGPGTLAQYLAVSTGGPSGEPLLDENFYEVLQQHFRSSMHAQTHQLRSQLNVSLPLVLGALNCVNVTDTPGAASAGARRGSTLK